MSARSPLTLLDIPWLRLAARQVGTNDMPASIADRLIASGLVARDIKARSLRITVRGQLALTRLG